jgi:hypothetical protein
MVTQINLAQKPVLLIASIFSLLGIITLIICAIAYQRTQAFINSSVVAQGTVLELQRSLTTDSSSYYPVIEFATVQGERIEFKSNFGSNPPSYQPGDTVSILYPEDNPDNAQINSFVSLWLFILIFAVVGGSFTITGMSLLFFSMYATQVRAKNKQELQATGKILITHYTEIERNTSIKINRRSPYRLITQWHDPTTNRIHLFKSENIWFNPEEFVRDRTLKVYVDPNNYQRYYMDIDFLPKLAK